LRDGRVLDPPGFTFRPNRRFTISDPRDATDLSRLVE
jgi:hypothetical protein